jgi:hypothetical protein
VSGFLFLSSKNFFPQIYKLSSGNPINTKQMLFYKAENLESFHAALQAAKSK